MTAPAKLTAEMIRSLSTDLDTIDRLDRLLADLSTCQASIDNSERLGRGLKNIFAQYPSLSDLGTETDIGRAALDGLLSAGERRRVEVRTRVAFYVQIPQP